MALPYFLKPSRLFNHYAPIFGRKCYFCEPVSRNVGNYYIC